MRSKLAGPRPSNQLACRKAARRALIPSCPRIPLAPPQGPRPKYRSRFRWHRGRSARSVRMMAPVPVPRSRTRAPAAASGSGRHRPGFPCRAGGPEHRVSPETRVRRTRARRECARRVRGAPGARSCGGNVAAVSRSSSRCGSRIKVFTGQPGCRLAAEGGHRVRVFRSRPQ